jgi:phage gp46-like protein
MADIALRFDPATGRCAPAFAGRDLAWDTTPASALLISLGSDRRARADDPLPWPEGETPARLDARRGAPCDALSAPAGRGRVGSRLWLLFRAKETESTRRRAIAYAEEATAWLSARGLAVTVTAAWVRRGVLALTARAGATTVSVRQPIAGGA